MVGFGSFKPAITGVADHDYFPGPGSVINKIQPDAYFLSLNEWFHEPFQCER